MRSRMRRPRDGIDYYDRIRDDQVCGPSDASSTGRGYCASRYYCARYSGTGERDDYFHHYAVQQRHGREEDYDAIQFVVVSSSTGRNGSTCANHHDSDHDYGDFALMIARRLDYGGDERTEMSNGLTLRQQREHPAIISPLVKQSVATKSGVSASS